ncbi:hypothetical protein JCM1840_000367 [Sporobolomyces johnsonii]
MRPAPLVSLLPIFVLFRLSTAQSCSQYGTLLSTNDTCLCPPGFGSADCSSPLCSNPLLAQAKRPRFDAQLSGNASLGCSAQCTSGFIGPNCNVCTSDQACSSAWSAAGGNATGASAAGLTGVQSVGEPICSAGAWTWTQGFATCSVVNPTLQSVFPGTSTLTFQKTVSSSYSLSASPGSNHSLTAALWYSPPSSSTNTTITEQFYCSASSCDQSNTTASLGSNTSSAVVDFTCQSLRCTCVPGTTFCGEAGQSLDLTQTIDGLDGQLEITCDRATGASCAFKQGTLVELFGSAGLSLTGCTWGECVLPATVDTLAAELAGTSTRSGGASGLSGGVIAGLAVLGAIVVGLLALIGVGYLSQRRARKKARRGETLLAAAATGKEKDEDDPSPSVSTSSFPSGVGLRWTSLSYSLPPSHSPLSFLRPSLPDDAGRLILPSLSGTLPPGSFCSVLGPSGAGKSTLTDLLAGVRKAGRRGGTIELIGRGGEEGGKVRIGYVDQADTLPATQTVREAVMFAADLRMGEVGKEAKSKRVFEVLSQLGLLDVADSLIGSDEKRGISGGERRRVSIALELVAAPAILIADEPTSGLDSTSALLIIRALKSLTLTSPASSHSRPTTVILTIHQPSSQIFQIFDQVLLLGIGGVQLYLGKAAEAKEWFAERGFVCPEGWNPADYLLDLASAPPVAITSPARKPPLSATHSASSSSGSKDLCSPNPTSSPAASLPLTTTPAITPAPRRRFGFKNDYQLDATTGRPSTTVLTQFEVLAGREVRNMRRDMSLAVMHNLVAIVVGLFVGGMYYKVDLSIAGFQSRIGSLFFLGCLLAFASLSALSNFAHLRALFLRERARAYYSPFAWVASRVVFDVVPLRLVPTVVLAVIVYWMVGLAHTAAHFFKYLLILVLFAICMTLWNFLLAAVISDVGIAILISSIINLFQLAFAGFFINLGRIPPVLRWLQWLAPLKYALEALAVNEVGSGLMIVDELAGARIEVSAELIMTTLFGFKEDAYYRDVLVLFAFIAGFGGMSVAAVLVKLRELR